MGTCRLGLLADIVAVTKRLRSFAKRRKQFASFKNLAPGFIEPVLDPPGDRLLFAWGDLPDAWIVCDGSSGVDWLVVDGCLLVDSELLEVGLGRDDFGGCLSLKFSSHSLSSAAVWFHSSSTL